MSHMADFSENLKFLRKENDTTQDDLANILSIDRTTISTWENGRREPDLKTVLKLADYFGVTTDCLLGHETVDSMLKTNQSSELNGNSNADIDKFLLPVKTVILQAIADGEIKYTEAEQILQDSARYTRFLIKILRLDD